MMRESTPASRRAEPNQWRKAWGFGYVRRVGAGVLDSKQLSESTPVFAASETSASRMLRWMPGSVGAATVSLCLPADERSVPASRQGVGRGGRRTTRRKSSLRSQTYTGSMPLDSGILTIT